MRLVLEEPTERYFAADFGDTPSFSAFVLTNGREIFGMKIIEDPTMAPTEAEIRGASTVHLVGLQVEGE